MIICHKSKIIFIHIPKNSGTAMTNVLSCNNKNIEILKQCEKKGPNKGIDKMHLYYDIIDKFIPRDILNTYTKFCIIRNPYNKLYSAWNFIKSRHGYNNVNDFIKFKLTEEFIYGRELKPGDARVHYRPQHTFVYDENGNQFVDFIIRYENLNNDIKTLNETYNLDIKQYGNNNTTRDYISLFTNESIAQINKLYEKDFKLFNYQMICT